MTTKGRPDGILSQAITILEELYAAADVSESQDDSLNAVSQWTTISAILEMLMTSGVRDITINEATQPLRKLRDQATANVDRNKLNVSERYTKEDDLKEKCKSIVPVEFISGQPACDWWFTSVIGMANEKREITNGLINPLKYPGLYGKITKGILLYGSGGTGKCLDPNTPVIMFDGHTKLAKDISQGDLLMGDDSTPRTVLNACTGRDQMYKIIPTKGEPFIVNQPHVLTLVNSSKPRISVLKKENSIKALWYQDGKLKSKRFSPICKAKKQEAQNFADTCPQVDVIDMPLNEYLQKSNAWKDHYRGLRVGVEFPFQEVDLDPYILGVWLGDGMSSKPQTSRREVGPQGQMTTINHMIYCLRKYKLYKNIHVPHVYKANTRQVRLALLAGLIGADGHTNSSYEICQKSEALAKDIAFVARSLGFYCSISLASQDNDVYYRIRICGKGLEEISTKRLEIQDVNHFDFSVEAQGEGDYCGFMLDGNGRFLLGDFTVTHNTSLVKAAINETSEVMAGSVKVLFYAPTVGQLKGKYFGESEKMIAALFDCASEEACRMQTDTVARVISVIFIDEIDAVAGNRSDDKFMATTVNALLQIMDGVVSKPNVTVIGATNLPWSLDSAILRRFSTSIYVKLPSAEDIYGLFSLELSKHIASVVGSKDETKLKALCDSLKRDIKDKTTGRKSDKCARVFNEELWNKPPYYDLMRNIDPVELRALAEQCRIGLYSNSDISRLFRNVVQRVADQAVATGTFVSYRQIPHEGKISTLSFSPNELYQMKAAKFSFLKPPDFININIEGRSYIPQSLAPFFNISDPSIQGVYIGNVSAPDGKITSYEFCISFVVELQQLEPPGYSTSKLRTDSNNIYSDIRKKLENEVTRKKKPLTLDKIGKVTFSKLMRRVGTDIQQMVIPGMTRNEQYFLVVQVNSAVGIISSTTSFLSQGWRYLTGSITDWSKVQQQEAEKYVSSLGVLKTLSSYSNVLLTTWNSPKGRCRVLDTQFRNLSVALTQAVYRTTKPIFSISAIDVMEDLAKSTIGYGAGEASQIALIASEQIPDTMTISFTHFTNLAYFFHDHPNIASPFGRLGRAKAEEMEKAMESGAVVPGLNKSDSDALISFYRQHKMVQSSTGVTAINLNISSKHFIAAQKEVRSTAKKEEIDLLEKYAQDPQNFKLSAK